MFKEKYEQRFRHRYRKNHHPAGRVLAGLVLVIVGVVLFMKKSGVIFPVWFFSWPVLLITIGIFFGAKRLFRGAGWVICILIGTAFLMERIYPDMSLTRFVWPALIILFGVGMMFSSRKRTWGNRKWDEWKECSIAEGCVSSEDKLESTSIFGGVKKNIISKNFRGGEITCIFGGAEINLQQADIQGTVEIELTQIFGGTKLTVPANWQVRHEATTAILGGIEDNRQAGVTEDESKVLVLKGTVIFGGVEIKSF